MMKYSFEKDNNQLSIVDSISVPCAGYVHLHAANLCARVLC